MILIPSSWPYPISRIPFAEDWDAPAGSDHDVLQIQKALDAVGTSGGGELWLKAVTYRCSAAPQIPKGVILRGQGENSIIQATGTDTSVLRTKDADSLYGVSDLGASRLALKGTSSQLYGLLVRGCDHGQFDRISCSGLTALTGSGWNGLEGAWGFYFTSFVDGLSTTRKSNNNEISNLLTKDSPNSLALASPTGSASDGSGGLNNLIFRCLLTGYAQTGIDLFGESTTAMSINLSTANNNTVGVRVRDAVTNLIGVDADSTSGSSIAGGTDAWGYPLGVRDNNNVGIYFYNTSSAIVINPTGNGCRKRLDFESITARNGVVLLRPDYHSISSLVTGIPQNSPQYTSDWTLDITNMGQMIRMNLTGTANTVTVPPNSSVPFPIGAKVEVYQYGTGITTIVAGAGVTIQKVSTLVSPGRFYRGILNKVLTDVWTLNWIA